MTAVYYFLITQRNFTEGIACSPNYHLLCLGMPVYENEWLWREVDVEGVPTE